MNTDRSKDHISYQVCIELARLRRIEEAAREVLANYHKPSTRTTCKHDIDAAITVLRTALNEEER